MTPFFARCGALSWCQIQLLFPKAHFDTPSRYWQRFQRYPYTVMVRGIFLDGNLVPWYRSVQGQVTMVMHDDFFG